MKKPKTKKKPPAPSVRKSWHDTREVNRKGATPWNDQSGLAHAMKEIGPDNDTAHGVLHGPYPTADDIKKAEGDGFIDTTRPGRDRSDVVADMIRQRNAPRGFMSYKDRVLEQAGFKSCDNKDVNPPIYSVETQDAAKMRECLSECAKIVADAIVQGAKIIAGKEDLQALKDSEAWNPVGPGTPLGAWLETAEIISGPNGTITNGFNTCMCRVMVMGDEPEWVEKEGGRTTVTHSTFAAPTHWRWPAK